MITAPSPAPASTKQPTTTNGWDCVSVIRFPDVNAAIVAQKSSPANFSQRDDDPDFGTITFTGDFGDWQLSGGDGKLVWIGMPLMNSVFTMNNNTHAYSKKMVASAEVNMGWAQQAGTSGYDLKVDQGVTISVMSIDVGDNVESNGKNISDTTIGIMKESLQNWLIKNIGLFDHVFASVDIATKVDQGPLGWLKPTDKFYAVTSSDDAPDDITKKLFAILCMTEGNQMPGDHEVSPFAIPDGSRASFLISEERVMRKMILPGLPLLFAGKSTISKNNPIETWADPVSADDFEFSDPTTLTNNVDMRFITQELNDGTKVNPVIAKNKFNFRIHSDGLELDLTDLNFEYSHGISVHINHTAPATLTIDGNRKFVLNVGNSTTSASVVESRELLIESIVASIAASIILSAVGGMIGGAVAGGAATIAKTGAEATVDAITVTSTEAAEGAVTNLTDEAIIDASDEAASSQKAIDQGVADLTKWSKFSGFLSRNWPKILGKMIGATLGGAVITIPNIIEAMANDHSSVLTIDNLGTEALAPITWPNLDKKKFVIKGGSINGCLQIGFDISSS